MSERISQSLVDYLISFWIPAKQGLPTAAYNGQVHDRKPNRIANSPHLFLLKSSRAYKDRFISLVEARAKAGLSTDNQLLPIWPTHFHWGKLCITGLIHSTKIYKEVNAKVLGKRCNINCVNKHLVEMPRRPFIKQTYAGIAQTYGYNVQTDTWILDWTQETPSNTWLNTVKPPTHLHTYICNNVGQNIRDPQRCWCWSKDSPSLLVSSKVWQQLLEDR